MYICICNAISDKDIKAAVYQGCCSLKNVQKQLPVGSECGTCCQLASEVIKDTLNEMAEHQHNQVA